jgi:Aldo/keto reductase family
MSSSTLYLIRETWHRNIVFTISSRVDVTGYPLSVQHQILERSFQEYGRNIWDQSLTYGHYNLHDTSLLHDDNNNTQSFVDYCQQHMIPVIAAAPLSMGLLTKRGPPEWHPASSDLKQACRCAVDLCQQHNVDVSTLAILFALSNQRISTTILGMSTIEEVKAVHEIALRFADVDIPVASTPRSQDKIWQSILSTDEQRVLDILRDRVHGPFASVWENGSYQWDGIAIAHEFWKLVPEQQVVPWQKK